MNRWKENLGTKKRTGDGAARWARRIFCAFLIMLGSLAMADALGEIAGKAGDRHLSGWENKTQGEAEGKGFSGNIDAGNERVASNEDVDRKSDSNSSFNLETEASWRPDFASLKQQNPDVIAWLRIPGMMIDEPIVQTTDNEKYRKTGLDGKRNPAGTVFLDCESAPDASDFHSIFYGHHMKDGSRFSELVRLKEKAFFQEHRTASLYFPDGTRHTLRLIAALTADSDGERRRTEFSDREELHSYMEEMTAGCPFRELPDDAISHLYSFVTCSYEFPDARTIVYAVETCDP